MSTDIWVNTTDDSEPKYALQVKYSSALDDERTVEKLEIGHRYWVEKGISWYLVTEQQIPKAYLDVACGADNHFFIVHPKTRRLGRSPWMILSDGL